MFAFCQQREVCHQNQRTKLLILRSNVDLLNYPFKHIIHSPKKITLCLSAKNFSFFLLIKFQKPNIKKKLEGFKKNWLEGPRFFFSFFFVGAKRKLQGAQKILLFAGKFLYIFFLTEYFFEHVKKIEMGGDNIFYFF